jgi:hypothetical protein
MRETGEDGRDGRRMEGRGLSLGGELSRFVCSEATMEDWIGGRIGRSETVSSRSTVDNRTRIFDFLRVWYFREPNPNPKLKMLPIFVDQLLKAYESPNGP